MAEEEYGPLVVAVRLAELRNSVDALTLKVGTQNGRLDKAESAIRSLEKQRAIDDAVAKKGKEMTATTFGILIATATVLGQILGPELRGILF